MRHKPSIEIFTYWEQLRGTADAPLRNLIQPGAVRHILPQLFILELMPNAAPRFRLAGTAICSLMGREIRGESFAALWAGSQASDPVGIATGVMEYVVPALINATGYSIGGRHMAFEMVLMPLRSSAVSCDRLLGCLTPAAQMAWLGNERLEFLALDRSRLLYERPARTIEAPPHPDPVDLAPPRDKAAGIGDLMRRLLNPKPDIRDQGPIASSRDRFSRPF